MADATMAPEWRQCKRFPDYEVSDTGLVRKGGRLLTQSVNAAGYRYVCMIRADGARKHQYVHRVVAEAFHGESAGEVNHLNADRGDNRACNLEWTSRAENMAYKKATDTWGRPTKNGRVLTEADVREMHAAYKGGETQMSIARRFGVIGPTVSNILTGKAWRHVWLAVRQEGIQDAA